MSANPRLTVHTSIHNVSVSHRGCQVIHDSLPFKAILNKYPPDNPDGTHASPSSDSYAYNQCAIRLSSVILKVDKDFLKGYDKGPLTSEGYARGG